MNAVVYIYPANTDPSKVTLPRSPTPEEDRKAEFYILRPAEVYTSEGVRFNHPMSVELLSWGGIENGWLQDELMLTAFSMLHSINELKHLHDEVTWVYLTK